MKASQYPKASLILLVALTIWAIPPGNLYAEVTFSDEEAGQVVVEVEKGRVCASLKDMLLNANGELTAQGGILKEQIQECREQNEAYQKAIEEKDRIIESKTGETFWERLKHNLGVFGIGGLTGVIFVGLIILL